MNDVTLPLTCKVGEYTWQLFTFEYKTPDGEFCGYLYAVSFEHASALLEEMKETAELKGQMVETDL